jgi:hypothetical protein
VRPAGPEIIAGDDVRAAAVRYARSSADN